MRRGTIRALAVAACAAMLAACQGNIGSGSGLSIPAAPAPYGQPGGPGAAGAAPQSRQRAVDGAVYLSGDMTEVPLPTVDGYGVTIALGSPTPSPSPTASPAIPSRTPTASTKRTKTRALAASSIVAVASPGASPSPSPATGPAAATASPAPSVSGSPSASASPAASGSPSARGGSPSPKAAKTTTKTVAFPDGAPAVPTPEPSGAVQSFPTRKAIVRGFIQPATSLALYGLGAIRFTIPAAEQTSGRGFTVAVFTVGRHHRDALVTSDASATLANGAVASARVEPLVLKAGTGYDLILYGDEIAPPPGSVPSGYPAPGNNPFVTPYPSGAPGVPGAGVGVGGAPQPLASPTPRI